LHCWVVRRSYPDDCGRHCGPPFIVAVVLVVIPWLIWGFAIHTERLHDRDRSAWWLLVFYVALAALGHFANLALLKGTTGAVLQYVFALTGFALTIWGLSNRMPARYRRAEQIRRQPARTVNATAASTNDTRAQVSTIPKTKKSPVAIGPPGEYRNLG